MIGFSWFSNFWDNCPQQCTSPSWEDFVETMRALSEVERYKPKADEYGVSNAAPLISPAWYPNEGLTRSNDNLTCWGGLVMLDIDDGVSSLDDVKERFKGLSYIMYSSPSNTLDKLKMRVVLPTTSPVPKKHCLQVWHAMAQWTNGWVDVQTKDASRIMYVPGRYTNKGEDYKHFFIHNKGHSVNWENLIKMYPSNPESERFNKQDKLKSLKQSIFKNNHDVPSMDISDANCPFVYKSMIDDYRLTPAGGHHGAIYKFMIRVCYRAEKIGYPLSVDDLVDMAKQLDQLDGGWYDDKKLRNSARDAIEYTGV